MPGRRRARQSPRTGVWTRRARAALLALATPAALACSNAGLQGLYLWPMKVTTPQRSCQVSVHLMFDGAGKGWMQPVDASCLRPGTDALASALRYRIDAECSGTLTDHHGRYQIELEHEDVEITLTRREFTVSGVATRQRDLMPGERALMARALRPPATP